MNTQQARTLVRETSTQTFDEGRFLYFIRNLHRTFARVAVLPQGPLTIPYLNKVAFGSGLS